jgi:hypothetical protein
MAAYLPNYFFFFSFSFSFSFHGTVQPVVAGLAGHAEHVAGPQDDGTSRLRALRVLKDHGAGAAQRDPDNAIGEPGQINMRLQALARPVLVHNELDAYEPNKTTKNN